MASVGAQREAFRASMASPSPRPALQGNPKEANTPCVKPELRGLAVHTVAELQLRVRKKIIRSQICIKTFFCRSLFLKWKTVPTRSILGDFILNEIRKSLHVETSQWEVFTGTTLGRRVTMTERRKPVNTVGNARAQLKPGPPHMWLLHPHGPAAPSLADRGLTHCVATGRINFMSLRVINYQQGCLSFEFTQSKPQSQRFWLSLEGRGMRRACFALVIQNMVGTAPPLCEARGRIVSISPLVADA